MSKGGPTRGASITQNRKASIPNVTVNGIPAGVGSSPLHAEKSVVGPLEDSQVSKLKCVKEINFIANTRTDSHAAIPMNSDDYKGNVSDGDTELTEVGCENGFSDTEAWWVADSDVTAERFSEQVNTFMAQQGWPAASPGRDSEDQKFEAAIERSMNSSAAPENNSSIVNNDEIISADDLCQIDKMGETRNKNYEDHINNIYTAEEDKRGLCRSLEGHTYDKLGYSMNVCDRYMSDRRENGGHNLPSHERHTYASISHLQSFDKEHMLNEDYAEWANILSCITDVEDNSHKPRIFAATAEKNLVIAPRSEHVVKCWVERRLGDTLPLPTRKNAFYGVVERPYGVAMHKNWNIQASCAIIDAGRMIPIIVRNDSRRPLRVLQGDIIGNILEILLNKAKSDEIHVLTATEGGEGGKSVKDFKIEDLHTGDDLSDDERRLLCELLNRHQGVWKDFNANDIVNDPRKKELFKNLLRFEKDAKPVRTKFYRTSYEKRQVLEKELLELYRMGIVQRSSSPWSSPAMAVPKPGGGVENRQ